MLQARILSYPDAQRYRLGRITNRFRYRCPLQPTITSVTGKCARTEMEGKPELSNSFDEMQIDQAYKEPLLRSIAVLQTGTIVIVKGKTIISPNRKSI
jgi:catalase